jgi:hypothetical protein
MLLNITCVNTPQNPKKRKHSLNMELSIMCESSFSELLVGTYMLHAEDMQNLSKVFTH